jgi:hypothetical protein
MAGAKMKRLGFIQFQRAVRKRETVLTRWQALCLLSYCRKLKSFTRGIPDGQYHWKYRSPFGSMQWRTYTMNLVPVNGMIEVSIRHA